MFKSFGLDLKFDLVKSLTIYCVLRKKLESFISSLHDGINDSEIDIDDVDDGEEETYQVNMVTFDG